jgi:hypothetical protein
MWKKKERLIKQRFIHCIHSIQKKKENEKLYEEKKKGD